MVRKTKTSKHTKSMLVRKEVRQEAHLFSFSCRSGQSVIMIATISRSDFTLLEGLDYLDESSIDPQAHPAAMWKNLL